MNVKILTSSEPVTLVGGGDCQKTEFERALALAPRIAAADGGAGRVLSYSKQPEAVIGDFDSLDSATLAALAPGVLHKITEQDSTDFDKAVRSIDAPLIIGVGFLGARIDHQLAALNVLARRADRRIVLIGGGEAVWHVPRRIALEVGQGAVVSLMPMAPVTGRSAGLEWPIAGLDFAPGGRIGTSNRATGPVQLEMDGPGMLAITPLEGLSDLVRALLSLPSDAQWPARA